MSYQSLSAFACDFEASQSAAHAVHKTSGALLNISHRQAWDLYQNTRRGGHLGLQVFGRHQIDQTANIKKFTAETPIRESRTLPEHLVGLSEPEFTNFAKVNSETSGSVLKVNADVWNLTVNDVWVCAGVHSMQPFYSASPINFRNIFNQNFGLTITGRELFGLALGGYKEKTAMSRDAVWSKVFVPSSQSESDFLTLVEYQVRIADIITRSSITQAITEFKQFFERAKFTIA